MAGKYCPKCNKRMGKALMITEMIAKWSDEGFYLPDDSNTDDMKTYEKCLACGTVLIEKPVKSIKKGKEDQKEFKYTIPDEYWERVHNLDYLVENFKRDPVDTERHINFKVQDATLISSREEVERQHKAWHERQKGKEKVMGELEEVLAIIDDDSTNPEGAELTDKQKAELKEVVKKAFEDA